MRKRASIEINKSMGSVKQMDINCPEGFSQWLEQQNLSFALSTHISGQLGKLVLVGNESKERLSILPQDFQWCGSLAISENRQTLCMVDLGKTQYFNNMLAEGKTYQGYDALFLTHQSRETGALDRVDLGLDKEENLFFVSIEYNFVGTLTKAGAEQCTIVWSPAEDLKNEKLQLTGLAFRDNKPRYVTAIIKDNANTGFIIDLETNQIIFQDLSYPHSPRWHNDKLWFFNEGSHQLVTIEPNSPSFEPIFRYQGSAKGLNFFDDTVIMGVNHLGQDGANMCIVSFVSNISGKPKLEYAIRIKGQGLILEDLAVLTDVKRPYLIGPSNPEKLNRFYARKQKLSEYYASYSTSVARNSSMAGPVYLNLKPQHHHNDIVGKQTQAPLTEYENRTRYKGEQLLSDPSIVLNAITRQKSTFSLHDLARFVSGNSVDAEQFNSIYTKVLAHPELIPLGKDSTGLDQFTIRKLLEIGIP